MRKTKQMLMLIGMAVLLSAIAPAFPSYGFMPMQAPQIRVVATPWGPFLCGPAIVIDPMFTVEPPVPMTPRFGAPTMLVPDPNRVVCRPLFANAMSWP